MTPISSRPVHSLERDIGLELYSTDIDGLGGRLKTKPEDFVVEEITPDGRVLEVSISDSQALPRMVEGVRSRYIRFTVRKMGIATVDLAAILAAELKLPRHMVTYAGLKDKRAITTQTMCVPSAAEHMLVNVSLPHVDISGLSYTRNSVQTGDLWGNRFTILLRLPEPPPEDMLTRIETLRETPLLNYFGAQRFGVTRPITHLVGRALLKRDYREAVRIMLASSSEYESARLKEVRSRLAVDLVPTEEMLTEFTQDLRYERTVMKHLIHRSGDFAGAIKTIPSRILTIFIHAYQSYLFNRIISERARSGMSLSDPEPGDFLIQLSQTHSGRDSWLYVTERNLEERAALVENEEYGIAAPVPGYSTKTPPSKQNDYLMRILEVEDVDLRCFRNKESRPLDSPGGLHLVSMTVPELKVESQCEGLKLSFRLRKGSYATVVMRELMKNHPINMT